MTRIEQLKKTLAIGEKTLLEEYEQSLNELFDSLNKDNILELDITDDKIERVKKLSRSAVVMVDLNNSLGYFFQPENPEETTKMVKQLEDFGWKTNTFPEQVGGVLCHTYQVIAERMKLHLIVLIDFNKLGVTHANKKPLGNLVYILKQKYPNNKFIKFLNTKLRNAVTHYTYFFEQGQLFLCDGCFDINPKKLTLVEFIKEEKKLNVLTEAFLLMFLDKYREKGDLILW